MNKSRLLVLAGMVVTVSLFRLLPHPPNFTPVLAVALFSGAQFTDKRMAFLLPFLAMLVADLFLGLHGAMLFVYGAIALLVLLGFWLKRHLNITNSAVAAVAGTSLFFIISNFGAWLVSMQAYPRTLDGLMAAYVAAIPFYQNTLLSTLFYMAVLFGGFYLIQRRYPKLAESAAA